MREIYQQMVDDSSPGRFEGEGPMTAYLYELYMNGDQGDDQVDFGDCDGLNRYGKRVLSWSSTGFIGSYCYRTEREAMDVMEAAHAQYDEPDKEWEG